MHGISAVIITKNEADNIGRCLESLKDTCDEVIVIDSFSEDATPTICREFGTRFVQREWKGYAEAKNFGNAMAKFNYILWIDADEALSEKLKTSIQLYKNQMVGGYSFNRLNNWCGTWVRHGGWYPDCRLRLFPKGKATWKGDFVHEYLEPDSDLEITHLDGDLLHFTYQTEADHWQRARKYALLGAKEVAQSVKKGLWWRRFLSPFSRWVKGYVFQAGFRDGRAGWMIARIDSWEKWLKYTEAMKMRRA